MRDLRKLTKEQFDAISMKRLAMLVRIVTKFINENVVHPSKDEWLDGAHLSDGVNGPHEFYEIDYGVFLNGDSIVSRSLTTLIDLSKAVKGFGFQFGSWGMRNGRLYLRFEESSFRVVNERYRNALAEDYRKHLIDVGEAIGGKEHEGFMITQIEDEEGAF